MKAKELKQEVTESHLDYLKTLSYEFEKRVNNIYNNVPYETLYKEYNTTWVKYCRKVDNKALDPHAFSGRYKPHESFDDLYLLIE